ncbi:hypothetical protein [Rubripirellula tenax]|uniref:hypothetical protein n=1 Tax=Rubripirellula tenax TaxID=2528015 RepID=UPI001644622E|nr:hypothetical protein [Rubripirellula tenax]
MTQYCDVLDFLAIHETEDSRRELLTQSQIDALVAAYPNAPQEYVHYLRDVGWGSVRESQYMVYAEPMLLRDLVHRSKRNRFGDDVLAFGDDFAGHFGCFRPNDDWEIVESFHGSTSLRRFNDGFGAFIRRRMLIGPDGFDQREPYTPEGGSPGTPPTSHP